jgi:DNA-directed RNA polymerase subunit RPC12/RpoP
MFGAPIKVFEMERSSDSLEFETEDFVLSEIGAGAVCGTCGETFKAPLLALVSSDQFVEEYYACPRCLSKVPFIKYPDSIEAGVEKKANSLDAEVKAEVEDPEGCTHNLGYLKQRSKGTPIPEECLTCNKMIECMY